jgi:CMP-N-acetylneuraminic acid synthetase
VNVLALIPAKSNSSRVPGKNLRLLGGKPLVVWTIEAALAAKTVAHVVVSTESPEVARVARIAGADVLDRPAELACDPAEAQDVAVHAVKAIGHGFDLVVMLLPTSPFRTAVQIDQAVGWHTHTQRNVVSTTSRPEARQKWFSFGADGMVPIESTHPQELNGAIWVAKPERILADGGFAVGGAWAYPIPRISGIDIDRPEDFAQAEAVLADGLVLR